MLVEPASVFVAVLVELVSPFVTASQPATSSAPVGPPSAAPATSGRTLVGLSATKSATVAVISLISKPGAIFDVPFSPAGVSGVSSSAVVAPFSSTAGFDAFPATGLGLRRAFSFLSSAVRVSIFLAFPFSPVGVSRVVPFFFSTAGSPAFPATDSVSRRAFSSFSSAVGSSIFVAFPSSDNIGSIVAPVGTDSVVVRAATCGDHGTSAGLFHVVCFVLGFHQYKRLVFGSCASFH
mmetsp:Transcript_32911/g.44568  ORF Transcript_32911/g.44568 Transcript_32911/m.44568 type:complete len:236 (+) Transcript_32911:385-1092(+)